VTIKLVENNEFTATMGNGNVPDFVYAAAIQVEGTKPTSPSRERAVSRQRAAMAHLAAAADTLKDDEGHPAGAIVIKSGNLTINGGGSASVGGNITASISSGLSPLTISGGHIKVNTILGNPLVISGAETVVKADSVNTFDFGGARTVKLRK